MFLCLELGTEANVKRTQNAKKGKITLLGLAYNAMDFFF